MPMAVGPAVHNIPGEFTLSPAYGATDIPPRRARELREVGRERTATLPCSSAHVGPSVIPERDTVPWVSSHRRKRSSDIDAGGAARSIAGGPCGDASNFLRHADAQRCP